MSIETYEILKALHQAAANGYDGAKDKDGNSISIGLNREKNIFGKPAHVVNDSRKMDGFKITVHGDIMKVNYHGEISIEDVYDKKFEEEVEGMIENIVSFLKKEYKGLAKKSLKLEPIKGSMKAIVQTTSKVRVWVQASKMYRVEGILDATNEDDYQKERDKKFTKWLTQTSETPQKAKNVKIKEKDNKKEEKD